MRGIRLWGRLLGLRHDRCRGRSHRHRRVSWWSSCGRAGESEIAAVCAGGVARAMTVVTACGAGAHWTWERRWCSCRPTRRVFVVASTGSWSPRCRGRGTARGHTREFDEQVAWLATQCSKTAITQLMRIAWRTVGSIITRVWADIEAAQWWTGSTACVESGSMRSPTSAGFRYLTIVVDHDSGRLVWAAPGRDRATLRMFFDELGPERSAQITHVSADQADWIAQVIAERCPGDGAVRRSVSRGQVGDRSARRGPPPGLERRSPRGADASSRRAPQARPLRALEEPREPHRPPTRQAPLDRANRPAPVSRPTCSKRACARSTASRSTTRSTSSMRGSTGRATANWRRSCGSPTPSRNSAPGIEAAMRHRLSNARVEAINTQIRLITRRAFGFHSADALIALAMLSLAASAHHYHR